MVEIRLTNTKTRRKEVFTPLDPKNVRMYVCGPTVYDRAHLGNARPVIVFDVLYRLLRHVYGSDHVTYVRNLTDVDDKINAEAQRRKEAGAAGTLEELIRERSDETIRWYHEDMAALGTLPPDQEPRATEYIPQMIAMIEGLIAKGHAYAAEGHVLFDVRSYPDYGKLSGRSVDDMIAGARVEVAPYKRDPMDFVLWKPSTDDLPGWESPWGRGRPGWHIECSAMADKLLWETPSKEGLLSENALKHPHTFDIHGGGIDLQFPHHENEIAQSMCMHPKADFARVWMHNEMLQVEGKKMSKSLGNFFTVRDLLEQYDKEFAIPNIGPAIRLRFLQTHYRSPVDISKSDIEGAAAKIDDWLHWLGPWNGSYSSSRADDLLRGIEPMASLADDLNTSAAVTWIDTEISRLRAMPKTGTIINDLANEQESSAHRIIAVLDVLGIDLAAADGLRHSVWSRKLKERSFARSPEVESRIKNLLQQREDARKSKDFSRSDAIRDGLAKAGVAIKDTSDGAEWELGSGFDLSKLETLK